MGNSMDLLDQKIKLKFSEILELFSLAFIFSIGISSFYKYIYYNELGIPWYIYSLTPQYIFTSTLPLLFVMILGILVSIYINSTKSEILINFVPFLGMFIYILIIFIFKTFLNIYITFFIFNILIFTSGIDIYNSSKKFSYNLNFKKKLEIYCFVFVLVSLFIFTALTATNASILVGSKDNKLNPVVLKSKEEGWYMLEMNGDKVLLIKNDIYKKFKIIEYKEIIEIQGN